MEGHVRFTEYGSEPVIRVRVFGGNASEMEIVAVVDTGFTGDLTLPSEMVAGLADDHTVDLASYDAEVLWHERRVRVEALAMGGTPLVGMELLRGNELCIQATPGGRVEIRNLP